MGDIQMKQFNRVLRQIKAKIDKTPDDRDLVGKYEAGRAKQLAFELQEFTDRCKNYPTDMSLRYELGRRLYLSGKHDDAIGAFQQAKAARRQFMHVVVDASNTYARKIYEREGFALTCRRVAYIRQRYHQ